MNYVNFGLRRWFSPRGHSSSSRRLSPIDRPIICASPPPPPPSLPLALPTPSPPRPHRPLPLAHRPPLLALTALTAPSPPPYRPSLSPSPPLSLASPPPHRPLSALATYRPLSASPSPPPLRLALTASPHRPLSLAPEKGSLTILRRPQQQEPGGARVTALLLAGRRRRGRRRPRQRRPGSRQPDACEKAALRLRSLLRHLQQGEVPAAVLQQNLQFAADVLESVYLDEARRQVGDEEDELSEVEPDAVPQEVREWLASTFTRQLSTSRRKTDEKPRFRVPSGRSRVVFQESRVVSSQRIRAGIFVERIYRRLSSATFLQLPPEVTEILKSVDDWTFNVWKLQEASNNTPLRCLAYELLNRYGLLHKFKNWLNDVEILATLMAALIHDYEHTGTTNNFHVMSGSETAILYNDRAVLENHHICAAFRLLRGEDHNVLVNLSREEYREFRSLVIEMVLATDMSTLSQKKEKKKSNTTPPQKSVFTKRLTSLPLSPFFSPPSCYSLDKAKALSLVLHCCDISHPSKPWHLHERWTTQLLEEFFRQGDKERELGLPYSPLCDRNNTLVAESQIGFIDFIVDPSLGVCGDLLDKVAALSVPPSTPTIAEEPQNDHLMPPVVAEPGGPIKRPVRPCGVVGSEKEHEEKERTKRTWARSGKGEPRWSETAPWSLAEAGLTPRRIPLGLPSGRRNIFRTLFFADFSSY
ncbi:putative calcium/calmodulin-dependent 3 [Penaeus vannamei]|uniref:Phosphodiesterase n=1 Tax=Penaeus vannamei TaxID=6689 RepID=A0A3R7PZU7_PENVA|nr:putative calcium/calmodulin-dependent 3 [Penaeus vannamei]